MARASGRPAKSEGEARRGWRLVKSAMRTSMLAWLIALAILTVALAFSMNSSIVSAATHAELHAQDCVNSTMGTPQPTPPAEEPTSTVGGSASNQLPCPTITATVNGLPDPMPGGFGVGNGGGPGGAFPGANPSSGNNSSSGGSPSGGSPSGPANSSGPGGSGSFGAKACSGLLCWLSSAASSIAHAAGSFAAGVAHIWANPIWRIVIVVAVVALVVIAIALFAPEVLSFALGAVLIGGLSSAVSVLIDVVSVLVFHVHMSLSDIVNDAIAQFAIGVVSFISGAWLGAYLSELGKLTWIQRALAPIFGDEWLSVSAKTALWGAGIKKAATWIAQSLVATAIVWISVAAEVVNDMLLHHLFPWPHPDVWTAALDTMMIWLVFRFWHDTTVPRAFRKVVLKAVEDTGRDALKDKAVDAVGQHAQQSASTSTTTHGSTSHSSGGGAW